MGTVALNLSVRAFVAPLEPSGSIDARRAALYEEDPLSQGARLHTRIQKRLLQEDPRHQSEVPVRAQLALLDFTCLVRGRIDLLLAGAPPVVEEIKTSHRPEAMLQAVREDPEHPFALQARMYAWMRWRDTGAAPGCRLRVLSLLDESEALLELPFAPEAFGAWVQARLEAQRQAFLGARERAAERKRLGAALAFPFPDPRPGPDGTGGPGGGGPGVRAPAAAPGPHRTGQDRGHPAPGPGAGPWTRTCRCSTAPPATASTKWPRTSCAACGPRAARCAR